MAGTKSIRRKYMEITVPHLPQDIILNILSRLPVKYLIQLKCVCKPWRSLISDPHFAKLQLAQSKKNISSHRFFVCSDPPQTLDYEVSDDVHNASHLEFPAALKNIPDSERFALVGGSCNGLICVLIGRYSRIFLWNPTIREAVEIASNVDSRDPIFYYLFGLGYDISTDDYKVVRSGYYIHKHIYDFEIKALRSNVWRKVEKEEPEPHYKFFQYQGIFLHGALHWLAKKPTKIAVILALDMVEEKFSELMELPDCIEGGGLKLVLTNPGDSLFLFCESICGNHLQAWQLNEYGVKSSWTKIFSSIACTDPEIRNWGSVSHYTKTGKIVLDCGPNGLFSYDPKEDTWKKVSLLHYTKFGHRFRNATYVESLVLPDWYTPTNP